MKEARNQLVVVGTLKSKNVKRGLTRSGENYISMELVVESKCGNQVHANKIKFWTKATSKLARGYETVAEEYKTIAEHGEENADRVKITGSLVMEEYVSKADGELKTFNSLKGTFVERVEDASVVDAVGAEVDCIINGFTDEIKDGKLTGRKKVSIYTIGYNSTVNELQNVYVIAEQADAFARLCPPNTCGQLNIKVENYCEVTEIETPQTAPTLGFGATLENMPTSNVSKKYVNELLIVGGDMGKGVKYTAEEIAEIKTLREKAKEEKMSVAPTPPAQAAPATESATGFGSADLSEFGF